MTGEIYGLQQTEHQLGFPELWALQVIMRAMGFKLMETLADTLKVKDARIPMESMRSLEQRFHQLLLVEHLLKLFPSMLELLSLVQVLP